MENLKEARKAKGISQYDAARMIGVHYNTYILWERGAGNPSPENMKKVKKLLEIEDEKAE